LRGLARFGAQTVPQLARTRGVSRQHVQEVVDALAADALVERAPNPHHARSVLVRATPRGEALVKQLDQIDQRVLHAAAGHLARADLTVTAKTLRAMREAFELEPRWRAAAPAPRRG
jgi:DNA-binding MarR family transcriptional regulator